MRAAAESRVYFNVVLIQMPLHHYQITSNAFDHVRPSRRTRARLAVLNRLPEVELKLEGRNTRYAKLTFGQTAGGFDQQKLQ